MKFYHCTKDVTIVPRTYCDVIVKTIAEKSKRLVSEYSFLPRTRKKSDVFLLGDVEFDLNMGPCEKFEIFDVLLIGKRMLQNLCEKWTVSVVCFNFF